MKKHRKTLISIKKPLSFAKVRGRSIVPIFGVSLDSTRKDKVLRSFFQFLKSEPRRSNYTANQKLFVATPNPEILVTASKDPSYTSVLQSASLCLPDGVGVVMAQKYLSSQESSRRRLNAFDLVRLGFKIGFSAILSPKWLFSDSEVIPGRVVFEDVCALAVKNNWRVFLLGGKDGVADQAAEKLRQRFGSFSVETASGPWLTEQGEPKDENQVEIERKTIESINKFKPDLLFVAFGHPKQEYWTAKHLSHLNTRAAMVVGGAFDYAAGIVPVPPMWVSQMGFEWFFRLVTQPWRIKRIATALFVFPWKVFLYSLESL